jgi:predicted phage terminase large subunit-like protein
MIDIDDTRDEARAELARRRLMDFATLVDPNYVPAEHLRAVCRTLEAMERGEIRNLIVLVPPRHGKTRLVSQILPAFWLGRHPRDEIVLASNVEDLSADNSAAARNIISSERYPFDTLVSTETYAKTLWRTTAGGVVRAAGVGSAIQGRGFNLGIVDDPIPGVEDASETAFERQWRWFSQDFFPRRLSDSHVILSMFRWGDGDLADRVLNHPDPNFRSQWTVLSLPALAREDDALGREPGEVLWPPSTTADGRKVGFSREFLELQRSMDARAWSAQYELDPQPPGGRLFKKEHFERRYSVLPERQLRVLSIDGAWKTGVMHSRSAIATWIADGQEFYLVDAWGFRAEYPELIENVKSKIMEQRPQVVLVEDAASGTPLCQELARWLAPLGIRLEARPPRGDKQVNAESVTPLFDAGKVFLPESAPFVEEWVTEHLRFPGKPNDLVDTTSIALKYLHETVLEIAAREEAERIADEWAERNAYNLRGFMAR